MWISTDYTPLVAQPEITCFPLNLPVYSGTENLFSFVLLICMQRVLGDGLLVVRKIENVATGPNNRPKLACVIAECGEM